MERRGKQVRPERRAPGPQRRDSTVRIPSEVARRVRDGHPFVFDEALRGRRLSFPPGQVVTLVDTDGKFVGEAVFDEGGSPPLRVFARRPGARLDEPALVERVRAALRWRAQVVDGGPTTCRRVLSGEAEGVPAVTVDQYGEHLVVCCYSPVAENYRAALTAALAGCLTPRSIYLQRRFVAAVPGRPRAAAELVWGAAAPTEVVVAEGRTRFVVDVTAPGGTGIYPDMRGGRACVARLAAGRRVLNCFSYTGAFSVVAAVHGAREVVSVDAASRAHSRARRNYGENGIDLTNPAYDFVTGDTFAVLAKLAERGRRFDLVILDPPTFSSGKGRVFTAMKDYAELVAAAVLVLEPGGVLLAASNAAKLPAEDLDRALGRGASLAGRELAIAERIGLPPDYLVPPALPEAGYLKVVLARVW